MYLRKLIKMGGLSSSVILLIGLNGCSSTHTTAPYSSVNGVTQPPVSFESSTTCANNAFLQKYQCSFIKVEQAARAGDPDAQYALGYLYYYGIGTAQDRQTGLLWIRKAAAQGQPVAQEALQALSTSKPNKSAKTNSTSSSSSSAATPLGSAGSTNTSGGGSNNNSNSLSNTSSSATNAQPDRPLTDYLPNYGEKRVDTTSTPPSVNLSAPPDQN